ncbi:MAG: hypothetical protein H6678_08845 [Candidatus Delongbacteria bacterium]|nr:hypothetical protein [Candidatus Delongbacteria bacterium]
MATFEGAVASCKGVSTVSSAISSTISSATSSAVSSDDKAVEVSVVGTVMLLNRATVERTVTLLMMSRKVDGHRQRTLPILQEAPSNCMISPHMIQIQHPGASFVKLGASFCIAANLNWESVMPIWVVLLWLMCAGAGSAAVLRVPADFPGVQQAMDASQAGDTVRVDRGVWTGLLDSPAHTLLFCSNYPFTRIPRTSRKPSWTGNMWARS